MLTLVFWEPCPSPHKSDLFDAILNLDPDIRLICCAHRDLSQERIALGWDTPKAARYRVLVAPSQDEILELSRLATASTIHVFSGIRWFRTIQLGLQAVTARLGRYIILSEPRVGEGFLGVLRKCHSLITEQHHRKWAAAVLAIGANGPSWFRSVGYSDHKIFPFAYFIKSPGLSGDRHGSSKLRLFFVGRIVREKGIFDVIEACAQLRMDYELVVVGGGPDLKLVAARAKRLDVAVQFCGPIPRHQINSLLVSGDILFLTSHSTVDGWGVAVTEALLAGLAIVTTKEVGSSVVITDAHIGSVVPAKCPKIIADAVRRLASDGSLAPNARRARMHLAEKCLTAESGARYFMKILACVFDGAPRPAAYLSQEMTEPGRGHQSI